MDSGWPWGDNAEPFTPVAYRLRIFTLVVIKEFASLTYRHCSRFWRVGMHSGIESRVFLNQLVSTRRTKRNDDILGLVCPIVFSPSLERRDDLICDIVGLVGSANYTAALAIVDRFRVGQGLA
jgi:hypothetical protein